MKYAVLAHNGNQYKVVEGEEILLDRLGQKDGKKTIEFSEVLLLADDGKRKIGTPFVKGVKVTASIVGEEKGKKVRVAKYKAKSRYRKVIGARPKYTRIKVTKITSPTSSK